MSDRLTSDYMLLEGNRFWQEYLKEIQSIRKTKIDMLTSISPEKLTRIQGEIYGIDLVLSTPERVLRAVEKGQESKED